MRRRICKVLSVIVAMFAGQTEYGQVVIRAELADQNECDMSLGSNNVIQECGLLQISHFSLRMGENYSNYRISIKLINFLAGRAGLTGYLQ